MIKCLLLVVFVFTTAHSGLYCNQESSVSFLEKIFGDDPSIDYVLKNCLDKSWPDLNWANHFNEKFVNEFNNNNTYQDYFNEVDEKLVAIQHCEGSDKLRKSVHYPHHATDEALKNALQLSKNDWEPYDDFSINAKYKSPQGFFVHYHMLNHYLKKAIKEPETLDESLSNAKYYYHLIDKKNEYFKIVINNLHDGIAQFFAIYVRTLGELKCCHHSDKEFKKKMLENIEQMDEHFISMGPDPGVLQSYASFLILQNQDLKTFLDEVKKGKPPVESLFKTYNIKSKRPKSEENSKLVDQYSCFGAVIMNDW